MPENFKKEDLRVEKTLKAIQEALLTLLERRNFKRITVNALCEEAQICRATFYTHFKDKYDLLEFCLTNINRKIMMSIDDDNSKNCNQLERTANQLIRENKKIISNIVKNANDETVELLYAFMLSFLDIAEKKDEDGEFSQRYIVLSNFCVGGMMKFLLWQIENEFPQDFKWNHYISMLIHILAWEAGQDYKG